MRNAREREREIVKAPSEEAVGTGFTSNGVVAAVLGRCSCRGEGRTPICSYVDIQLCAAFRTPRSSRHAGGCFGRIVIGPAGGSRGLYRPVQKNDLGRGLKNPLLDKKKDGKEYERH